MTKKKVIKKVAKKIAPKKAVVKKAATPKPKPVIKKTTVERIAPPVVEKPVPVPVAIEEEETILPETVDSVQEDMDGTMDEVTPESEDKKSDSDGPLM